MGDERGTAACSRTYALCAFKAYVAQFDESDERIALKVEHTFKVADLCDAIARGEGLCSQDVDLAWTCGLLHDIGRFEQLRRWNTFSDAQSCGHARLGLCILEGEAIESVPCMREPLTSDAALAAYPGGELGRFTHDASWVPLIKLAVGCHSDFVLPHDLTPRERLFCSIVRDADKVDILRVFSESSCDAVLGIDAEAFARGSISEVAMRGFGERRCLARDERPGSLDGLVGAVCLAFELEHPASERALKDLGYLGDLLDHPFGLAPDFTHGETREHWEKICAEMARYRP